ncbi:MAG: glucuronosyltransferase [Ignavibacteria bacterium]
MPKAVLITSHFWNSKRKAGFHNIAESLVKKGYEILFLTGNASYIHHLKSDYRAGLIKRSKLNELEKINDNVNQFIRFTKLHPVNYRNKILNTLFLPSIKKYSDTLERFDDVNDFIKNSELFIFESFPGLLWFDHFKKLNNKAKFVYRVSDDMRQLNKHPYVIEHEMKIAGQFDLISVPSGKIFDLFKVKGKVRLHHHGIRKDLFDNAVLNPYSDNGKFKFVFTGNAYLDRDFINIASGYFPNDEYHIIGPFKKTSSNNNVHYYGEMNYNETIPYIKFADCGLHTLEYSSGAESFSDSLKVIQYTYSLLPIIAPDFIKSARDNFIYYKPEDKQSIIESIEKAKHFNKSKIESDSILSWDELTDKIINE